MNFLEKAQAYKEDYLKDLDTLVEIESTRDLSTRKEKAPFGRNCREALDRMMAIGKRDGFDIDDVDGYAGVISYGNQDETFGMVGHLDIVPIGNGWSKPPLHVTESQGYVFGRGVMDDKGPALAAYYAMKLIKDCNIPLKKKVMLVTGCDEESNMECMEYYTKNRKVPDMGFVPDAFFPCIYAEKGLIQIRLESKDQTVIKKLNAGSRINIVIDSADAYVESINEQQKKEFEYYLKVNALTGNISEEDGLVKIHMDGKAYHGAWPYLGVNAALHVLNYIGCSYQDALARDLYFMLKDWMGKPLDLYIEGEYLNFLTINTGIVRMENNQTSITLDIRYPNDITGSEIFDKFKNCAQSLESNIIPVIEGQSDPLFVDPNSDLVKVLMNVYQKYTKDTFHGPKAIGGGTYARHFKNFVSYGPEKPWEKIEIDEVVGGCHEPDEGIKLDYLMESIAIYADAIVTLCS